ncbi:MAG: hypothetical protein LBU70_05950, partial [Chitinispirillales bacterium]|jgi:hypothetical protein|nr:hypothetical protein [Chitinispirillales bacterium]
VLALTVSAQDAVYEDSAITAIVDNDEITIADDSVDSSAAIDNDESITTDNDIAATTTEEEPPARRGIDIEKLLAEDDDDDLLGDDPVVAQPETTPQSESPDSLSEASELTPSELGQVELAPSDTVEVSEPPYTPPMHGRRAATIVAEEPAEPAVIEDGRTINFAHNLEGYRSPRLAMLLSLLVPGLGQAYSRNYTKAAAFGSVELATIGVALYLHRAGRTRRNDAYRFADENFSVDNLRNYHRQLKEEFERRFTDEEGVIDFDVSAFIPHYDDFFDAAASGRMQYSIIGDATFAPGWMDNEPHLDQILQAEGDGIFHHGQHGSYRLFAPGIEETFFLITRIVDGAASNERILGFSNRQVEYNDMIQRANNYSDAVNYALYALLVNHIASAIDAGFTARAHNRRLLGKESMLSRISVEQHYVFTGSEVSPGLALRVKF